MMDKHMIAERQRMAKAGGMSEKDAVMVSMKRSPKAMKMRQAQGAGSLGPPQEEYPYGLQVRLDDEALKKVGLSSLPEVGEIVHLHAKAKVQSVSQNANEDYQSREACFQITDLALDESGDVDDDEADEADDE